MGAMNGVPMVSYFKGCDPLKAGEIDFADQMIPFMVMRLFRNMPGFAGLFVSSVYSGMLRLEIMYFSIIINIVGY